MKAYKYIFSILFLILALIWLTVLTFPGDELNIIACDVGQGDGILITLGSAQVIIDGGPPNNKMLDCLAENVPFWDRNIELMVITHPQLDHYGGLVEVLKRYKVDRIITNDLKGSSSELTVLRDLVESEAAEIIAPQSVKSVSIGLISLDIVWPIDYIEANDSNDISIVFNLSYGEFKALFTGDIGPAVIPDIIATGKLVDIDYLKVPHHGSKNGLTQELLDITKPEIAVINVGKNQWGHPHQEVLDILKNAGVNVLRTDLEGNIKYTL